MQIGNRKALDDARNALRDQFDAVWLAADTLDTITTKEVRAMHCAIRLDKPNYQHNRGNWTIWQGGRGTGLNAILYA